MSGIKIRGTGRCVPQHVVTNDDIAKIVETNDEWITTRTGIRRRHHCANGENHTAFAPRRPSPPWRRQASVRRRLACASWLR